ncbi:MAG TPA: methyltransferase [Candidatus Saccharimonadales bacterium]|nr:methyltransferase [Candidatus Saccharimonadales bacterium]
MATVPAQHTTETPNPHPGPQHVQHVFQIASGILIAAAFHATLRCRIPDQLSQGPKSVVELARTSQVDEHALHRCLRAVAATGIFTEVSPGVFANTPASEVLRSDHPSQALDTALWMSNSFHFRTYSEFMHSVRTGEPCVEKAFGMPVFDYFPTDPECNSEFNNAMTSITAMVVPAVLDTYDFAGLGTLCDVAGGHGRLLTSILQKHTDLRGIILDLDHVIRHTQELIATSGIADRCEAVSGNFFESVPTADSYIMKNIIHDWEESKALTILRNCVRSMRGDGKILLVEAILPEGDQPHMGKVVDIEMLAMPGGQERTANGYRELLAKAGLRVERILPNESPLSLIEAVKA